MEGSLQMLQADTDVHSLQELSQSKKDYNLNMDSMKDALTRTAFRNSIKVGPRRAIYGKLFFTPYHKSKTNDEYEQNDE